MKKSRPKPRKRTGSIGPIKYDGGGFAYEKVNFPDEKEQIELLIVGLFLAHPAVSDVGYFLADSLVQNAEDDFDFTVQTTDGPKYLELMEFAPLDTFGGDYDKVPSSMSEGIKSDLFTQRIEAKSARYSSRGIILLTYPTDHLLSLEPDFSLLKSELNRREWSFERIYYLKPHSINHASTELLYPLRSAVLSPEEERRRRSIRTLTLRPDQAEYGKNYVSIPLPKKPTISVRRKPLATAIKKNLN